MVTFHPARASKSIVASCKLPFGIPSFNTLIPPPCHTRLPQKTFAPPQPPPCHPAPIAGKSTSGILHGKLRAQSLPHAPKLRPHRSQCAHLSPSTRAHSSRPSSTACSATC